MQTLNCICCGKEVEQEWKKHLEELDDSNVDKLNFDYATGIKIFCGYGSTLDGNVYITVVCDDCLRKASKDNRAVYITNYLFGDKNEHKED
jgi:DNA-directed RNA polymerase subunit N (RpoN/RPB10)